MLEPIHQDEDHEEPTVRPGQLDEFVGQQQVKDALSIAIQSAQLR
ncbi:MAG: Holliday junction branch migration DNA helicase RuvB, partial [Methanomicrobiales archaeon HGW-Methanomicrobiales-4]